MPSPLQPCLTLHPHPNVSKKAKTVRFAPDCKEVDTYAISASKYRRATTRAPRPSAPPKPSAKERRQADYAREESIIRQRVSYMARRMY